MEVKIIYNQRNGLTYLKQIVKTGYLAELSGLHQDILSKVSNGRDVNLHPFQYSDKSVKKINEAIRKLTDIISLVIFTEDTALDQMLELSKILKTKRIFTKDAITDGRYRVCFVDKKSRYYGKPRPHEVLKMNEVMCKIVSELQRIEIK